MDKMIIWGAQGISAYLLYKNKYEIIAFADNNQEKWGGEITYANKTFSVLSPSEVLRTKFDYIAIDSMSYKEIIKQLLELGININKLIYTHIEIMVQGRINFLYNFGQIEKNRNREGAIAELGVYRGEFAAEISNNFPIEKMFLFDTFEGFDRRDVEYEKSNLYSQAKEKDLNNTSIDIVVKKILNPERVIVCKGYFPETTKNVEENILFKYVNLDVDLYKPTLEGLKFFYPRMLEGGIITVHDYFQLNYSKDNQEIENVSAYQGVQQAVLEFENLLQKKLKISSMGDGLSLIIIK